MIPLLRGPERPACLPHRTPWLGAVYAFALLWVVVAAYVWPLSMAIIVPVASGLLMPLWVRPQRPWPVIALVSTLAFWAVGALAWSPALARIDPLDTETQTGMKLLLQLSFFGFFAAGAQGLSGLAARRVLILLTSGLVALGAVLLIEGATSAPGYRAIMAALGEPIRPDLAERNIGKGQFVLALLAWPAFVFLREQRPVLIAPILVAVALSPFLLAEAAPIVAFLAGGVAFLLVAKGGAWSARAAGLLLAVQMLASPWVVAAAASSGLFAAAARVAPASWAARLEAWSFTAARILERPWLGWGMDASRTFPAIPLHPHNAGLQVWLELGVVGALLFALIWLRVFESVARLAVRDRTAAAGCAGSAGAYFTIGALSHGVWQEWWLALAAVLVAVCTAMTIVRDRERLRLPPRRLHENASTPL